MPSDYKFVIELDDTKLDKSIKKMQDAFKKIEVQLDPIKKATSKLTGSSGGDGDKKQTSLFEGMFKSLKSIGTSSMALIGIGTGIGALVSMIVDASPILQSMLKLLQTGIMLILRPIGDFIGFILRPIMILFLQTAVIPFYRTVYPWFKKYGNAIGEGLVSLLQGDIDPLRDLVEEAIPKGERKEETEEEDRMSIFQKMAEDIKTMFGNVLKYLDFTFLAPLTKAVDWAAIQLKHAWQAVVDFIIGIPEMLAESWGKFVEFIINVGAAITATLQPAWNQLMLWGTLIYGTVKGGLTTAWNTLTAMFSVIKSVIDSTIVPAWGRLVAWFMDVKTTITGTLSKVWKDIVTFFKSIADALKSIWDKISSLAKSLKTVAKLVNPLNWGASLHAEGGLLTEPVVGIGLSTGRQHVFGERGAEMITPLSKAGGGGYGATNITIHLYGSGSSGRADAELIAREVQKILNKRGVI